MDKLNCQSDNPANAWDYAGTKARAAKGPLSMMLMCANENDVDSHCLSDEGDVLRKSVLALLACSIVQDYSERLA